MSALAGYFNTRGEGADPSFIDPMLNAMSHRFLGEAGRCHLGPTVLGYGAFPTTKEEEHVYEPCRLGKMVLVLDGRLDNRNELIGLLGINQVEPSDNELLLRSYRKWGEECLTRLEGVFSFALWNGERFFCARDRFGIKPFNYYYDGRFFAFASEAKGLLPLPQVDDRLDEEQLCLHFHTELKILDPEKSYFRDIKRLPPAHYLIVDHRGIKKSCYWRLDPGKRTRYKDEQDYYDRFSQLLRESVNHRMRSNCPVGSTLSGGLDSSSITCLARDYHQKKNLPPLNTFSCLFDKAPGSDEREWINSVEEQGGLNPIHLHPDEVPPLEGLEDIIRLNEGPFFGPNYYIQRTLFTAAASRGHRVLLDGEDGDGIVSHGYDFLVSLVQSNDWNGFFREADAMAENFDDEEVFFSRTNLYRFYGHPYMTGLLRHQRYLKLFRNINLIHESINLSRKRYIKLLMKKESHSREMINSFLSDEMQSKYHIRERLEEHKRKKEKISYPLTDNHYHYLGIEECGNSYILEYLERLAAWYGIESRHPFFDRELAEYCLSLPSHIKLRGGLTRHHFREAMKGILPEKVRLRGGKGDLTHSGVRGYRLFNSADMDRAMKPLSHGDPLLNSEKTEEVRKAYVDEKDDSRLIDCWYLTTYGLWRQEASKKSPS